MYVFGVEVQWCFGELSMPERAEASEESESVITNITSLLYLQSALEYINIIACYRLYVSLERSSQICVELLKENDRITSVL